MKKRHTRRTPMEWYKEHESLVKWILILLAGAASFYLSSKFVTQELFWKMYREQNCRISTNEKDIEILKERTRR